MISTIVEFDHNYSPEIISIRTQVFVAEQGVMASIDFDGKDEEAIHVLVYENEEAIATARMLEDGHIGRIAVLKKFRRQGAGGCALEALLALARKKSLKRVYLGSQTHAVGFYLKKGFKVCGDVFIEAGIEHVDMECYL